MILVVALLRSVIIIQRYPIYIVLIEPELASLVGLQVVSSKEGERRRENFLTRILALSRSTSWPWGKHRKLGE